MSTIVAAVFTALLTTLATSYLVGPRTEARNRRIQEIHIARENFGDSIFTILTHTARLLTITVPADATRGLAHNMRGERARWMTKLDEATIYLIDETERFALSYPGGLGIRELAAECGTHIRAVWLSERPLDKKLRLMSDMASLAQGIYFTAWWRKRRLLHHVSGLRALIEDASENRR